MRPVRYSEYASFRRCPRQWYLGWFKRKVSKTARTRASLLEGSAVHAGIEEYNKGGTCEEGILAYTLERIEEEQDEESKIALAEAASMARIYLEAFPDWVETEHSDVGKEVLFIEQRVSIELPEVDVELFGRIDRAVRDDEYGGRPVVEDYKTAGDFRQRPVQADAQLLTYACGLSKYLDEPVAAGRHIRIKKNKRTARSNPPYFDVHDNVYTPDQLTKHMRHTVAWAKIIEGVRDKLLEQGSEEGQDHVADFVCPPSPGFHCTSPACPYMDVCSAMDDGSDWYGILDEHFVDRADDELE